MPFRILILGGGFTGLEAARRLARRPGAEVMLVEPGSHAFFTPRLVDALARSCREPDLRAPHAEIARRNGYAFIQGKALDIAHVERTVRIERADGTPSSLGYDTLICAYGAETNFYGLEGREHAYPLKTWEHLIRIEERLEILARRKAPPRIAVIGGGASGIEAAFALDRRLHLLERADRELTVYQAGPQILPGFLPKTIERAEARLARAKIALRVSTPAKAVHPEGLEAKDGTRIPADLVLWTAGVKANDVPSDIPDDGARAGLMVTNALQVAPRCFAGGDAVRFRDEQQVVPKNAQTAMKMGAHLAENVWREHAGLSLKPFHYRSPGVMLWLGDTAITDLFHLSLPSPLFIRLRDAFYDLRWSELRGRA